MYIMVDEQYGSSLKPAHVLTLAPCSLSTSGSELGGGGGAFTKTNTLASAVFQLFVYRNNYKQNKIM